MEMSTVIRRSLALACTCASIWIGALSMSSAQAEKPRTFATPEDAVNALVGAAKAGDLDALLAIFGADGRELFASSDPETARQNRQVFTAAVAEQWHLEESGANRRTLVI